MEDTKKIIHICREIPALEVDKEGHLRGGFVGLSSDEPISFPKNTKCENDGCNNPYCLNEGCTNINECSNFRCNSVPYVPSTPTPKPSPGGSYVSLGFLL